MNRQTIRIVAGANLVAGCLLLQGCGMFGKKSSEQSPATIPEETVPPATTQTVEQATVPAVPAIETPVELPEVKSTTPYTIQKGDTISGVAYRFGLRWQDVVAVNPGVSPKRLRVGQVIQLPGMVDLSQARRAAAPARAPRASAPKISAPKTSSRAALSGPATDYVVRSGDSLSLIAHKHGIKTAALREANGLKNDKIVVGQKLKVPGATKKVSESAPAKKASAKATAAKTTAPKASAEKAKPEAATSAPTTVTVTPPPPVETAAPAPAAAEPAAAAPAAGAAPAPAAAADSNTQTYTVKEGEDLYAVAIRWGVSPSDLKSLNNLTSTELKAGTVLKIPNAQ